MLLRTSLRGVPSAVPLPPLASTSLVLVPVRQRFDKARGGEALKPKSAAQVLADEARGQFRQLDLGKTTPRTWTNDGPRQKKEMRNRKLTQDRATVMSPYQDWQSVWPAPRTFHPSIVPLPVRQGYIHLKSQVHPHKKANAELMKIPNFLHATPPAIKKQCELIRKWCTEYPKGDVEKCYPVEVTTSTYLNSSSSIRDHRARKVSFAFPLKTLSRSEKFNEDKFRRLVGDRYDEDTGMVTIEADCCPYRSQNDDYASYLMTAVFHESCRKEAWEDSKTEADMAFFDYDLREDGLKPAPGKASEESTRRYREKVKAVLEQGEDAKTLDGYKEAVKSIYSFEPFEASNAGQQ